MRIDPGDTHTPFASLDTHTFIFFEIHRWKKTFNFSREKPSGDHLVRKMVGTRQQLVKEDPSRLFKLLLFNRLDVAKGQKIVVAISAQNLVNTSSILFCFSFFDLPNLSDMMGATFSCHDDAQQDHANIIRINPNMVTELAAILKKKKFFFSSQSEEASFQYNKLLFFFFSSTLIPFNSLVLCVKSLLDFG